MSIISFCAIIDESPSLLVSDGCDLPNYDLYGDQKAFCGFVKIQTFYLRLGA